MALWTSQNGTSSSRDLTSAVGGPLASFGHSAGAASPGFSFVLQSPALAPFYAVQAIYTNFGAEQTITAAKVAACPVDLSDGTALTWQSLTFNGSASATQLAGSGTGSNMIPSITLSDVLPLTSIPRTDFPANLPLIQSRTYFAAASTQRIIFANAMADYKTATGLEYASGIQGADIVSTITAKAPATSGSWLAPSGFIFFYGVPTVIVADVGDSLMRGQESSVVSNGWRSISDRTVALKTRPTKLWQHATFSVTGQAHDATYKTGLEVVTKLKPKYLCFRASSPNDGTPTQAIMDACWARTLHLVDHCKKNGVIPVLCTSTPINANSAPADALLKAQNARVRSLAGAVIVSDEALVIENPADRSQISASFNSGDGIHLNSAAYDLMAAVRSAALTS